MFQLPKDLTPLERARLKLISHFIIIFVFNAIFAGYLYFVSITQDKPFNWQILLQIAASQGALALLDALKKYFSAQGDLPVSVLVGSAATEIAAKAPIAPSANVNEQAIAQSVAAMLIDWQSLQDPSRGVVVSPGTLQQTMITKPQFVQTNGAGVMSSQTVVQPADMLNTIPSMPVATATPIISVASV